MHGRTFFSPLSDCWLPRAVVVSAVQCSAVQCGVSACAVCGVRVDGQRCGLRGPGPAREQWPRPPLPPLRSSPSPLPPHAHVLALFPCMTGSVRTMQLPGRTNLLRANTVTPLVALPAQSPSPSPSPGCRPLCRLRRRWLCAATPLRRRRRRRRRSRPCHQQQDKDG